MKNPQYLGDGVYVHDNGCGLTITTGHHEPKLADNAIVLEPDVAVALVRYIEKMIKPT